RVAVGLTSENVAWAFKNAYYGNWAPLTLLSHMLDVQLFGLQPAGHHATNLLLHTLNVLLLFLALQQMTARTWPSAVVAALFAVHPAHVESVAWISARKDVLSGLFLMLTLLAYIRYARAIGVRPSSGAARYGRQEGLKNRNASQSATIAAP